ncbi:glycerophosphodiester phosphodiesterase family protein [Nesterenkonia muleiensis]|uniref:glycerophosphodiester phosphodiesterase family protein n=1 Tax=Nesterenkonia muleiensis TaxID=2282648 RepID=UPI001300247F|nr:glycerophosphodiester phosphodiesterase family protein [Nesterenkonia muleiensis]
MSALPEWLSTRPVAHRGLHSVPAGADAPGGGIPENTLAAFDAAVEAGFPIELDVQLSADDQAVVFHDRDLLRLCGSPEPVRTLRVDQLREHRVAGTDQHPPSLAETLEFIAGRVPVLVEIKTGPQRNLRASATAAALGDYSGELAVQSFDPFIVAWFRRNSPLTLRGQLSGSLADAGGLNPLSRAVMRNLGFNAVSRPHFVGYEFEFLSEVRARLITRRWPLLVWTITSQADMDRVHQLGGNVIFEGFSPASREEAGRTAR